MNQFVISMKHINKAFFGVQVLKNVDFELCKGEIHALLGENGAGKTTLMRILTAEYLKDDGEISINGRVVNLQSPKDAIAQGIAFVHQELSILDNLTVGENIYLGRLPQKGLFIDWKSVRIKTNEILKQLNVDFDANTPAEKLSTGQLQMVEISKALSLNADVFIMDEPTASLSKDECGRLFRIMRKLAEKGISFIYISHRLNEVMEISDRITVLRDGGIIGTVNVHDANKDLLSEMIVGRNIEKINHNENIQLENKIALKLCDIVANKVDHVSMEVHQGEIVSLYGLVGSGRTELLHAILGIDERESGTVEINGNVATANYQTILKSGVGYLPEERKTQAVFTDLPMFHNLTISNLAGIRKKGLLNYPLEKNLVNKYIHDLKIKAKNNDLLSFLSGGTQQKIALAKWLYAKSSVLLLDEPTKGIDIAARFDLYQILRRLADQGIAILIVSSDVEEVLEISDRVLVMSCGSIVADLNNKNLSEELILSYAIN